MTDMRSKGAEEAMDVAESSRETEWEKPSFAGDLFLGKVRFDLIHPFPEQDPADRAEADAFLATLEQFLAENVDADEIDRTGDYPAKVVDGFRKIGAFGMKIPKEYGGLGFSSVNYMRAVSLIATWCGSSVAWVSAHQSIGVPQPLKLFGTEEQKKKWMPRLAKGAISAFALTEPGVGSDPARMKTTATPTPDGKGWIINGEKLWTTNGPDAELIVVMAQTPPKVVNGREKKQITAFVVEADTPGVETAHRCHFMGLRGISNGLMRFTDVYVPNENLIWGEGLGLKLALITLNTGRLTIPAGCAAAARRSLEIVRDWANERVQWGSPIGKHDAIAQKLAWMASHTLAMEAIVWLTSGLTDRGDVDLRLEAAMAKMFNTEVCWKIVDDLVQIRGGRGYETAESLEARGEKGYPVERILRDMRINRIFEGTTEIQHLFIAREAVDPHMKRAGVILQRDSKTSEKAAAAAKAGAHYAFWYPKLYAGWSRKPVYGEFGSLGKHRAYIDRTSRRLARSIFHAMMRYQAKLERKQSVLFRIVDIGTELFAMGATISYAMMLKKQGHRNAVLLADHFCRESRTRVEQAFDQLFSNHDPLGYRVATRFLDGEYEWLEGRLVPRDAALPSSEELEAAMAVE
jgi:alkylation response protein AidB-like acyl-CoA dehydrogenase